MCDCKNHIEEKVFSILGRTVSGIQISQFIKHQDVSMLTESEGVLSENSNRTYLINGFSVHEKQEIAGTVEITFEDHEGNKFIVNPKSEDSKGGLNFKNMLIKKVYYNNISLTPPNGEISLFIDYIQITL